MICEAPRLTAHRQAVRSSIAEIAGLDEGRISVKATTSEMLGFTGAEAREGLASHLEKRKPVFPEDCPI